MENVLGPPVGVFFADDLDSGENAKVIYSIEDGNDSGKFKHHNTSFDIV